MPSRLAIKATGIRAISSSASNSNWAVVGVNDISYLWCHTRVIAVFSRVG